MSAPKPITFTRSGPSKFVLLVAKSQESGIVGGAEDTAWRSEWATDRDMRAAGYMPVADGRKLVALVREAAAAAQQADDRFTASEQQWVEQAERIVATTITQG